MATTYLLAGGNDLDSTEYGESLARFVHTLSSTPTILSCFFARNTDDKEAALPHWKQWFVKNFPNSVVMDGQLEKFYEQVQGADVVYLHGGNNNNLVDLLPDFLKFEEAVQGKIVIGSSAGANYLSAGYYGHTSDSFVKGSGIIPIPALVHYGARKKDDCKYNAEFWTSAVEKVKSITGIDSVLCLQEGTFTVFQK